MNSWYTAAVKYTKEYPDGTLKRVTEKFLLSTMSFTEAEARIYKEVGEYVRGEFLVTKISKTDFADIFEYDDSEKYYKAKVSYVSEDADSGKERKINNNYLVSAKDVKEAYERIEESLKGLMVTYEIPSIVLTDLMDIFPYEPMVQSDDSEDVELINPTKGKYKGVPMIAIDREQLIATTGAMIDHEWLEKSRESGNKTYYLALSRSDCGCSEKWENAEDIPDNNVYCEHGNPMLIYDPNLKGVPVKMNGSDLSENEHTIAENNPNINVEYKE